MCELPIPLKTGDGAATFYNPHPELESALPTVKEVLVAFDIEAVITEGNDTINRPHNSYHKTNPLRAIDLRTWTTPTSGVQIAMPIKKAICRELHRELPAGFRAKPKTTHIHLQYEGE